MVSLLIMMLSCWQEDSKENETETNTDLQQINKVNSDLDTNPKSNNQNEDLGSQVLSSKKYPGSQSNKVTDAKQLLIGDLSYSQDDRFSKVQMNTLANQFM